MAIIKWVDNNIIITDKPNHICECCKEKITTYRMRKVVVQFKGFGRGDDEVIFLHPDCYKPTEKENHITYAARLLSLINLK